MASDESLAASLMRGLMKLNRRARAAPRASDVSLSAIGILGALRRKGPMPAARLAEQQRLQPQSLTRLIADLEERGLIERERGAVDKRTLILSLTGEGVRVLMEEMRARRAWLEKALQELTASERASLKTAAVLMERIADWEGDEEVLGIERD